jgi:peroxiredoxin
MLRRNRFATLVLALAGLTCSGAAAPPTTDGAPPVRGQSAPPPKSATDLVGKPAPPLVLEDTTGKTHDLSAMKGRIVVLEWVSPICPATGRVHRTSVVDRLIANLKRLAPDVVYVQVCSTKNVQGFQLDSMRRQMQTTVPVLLDQNGAAARDFGPTATPHCIVIDTAGVVRYTVARDNDPVGKSRSEGKPVLAYPLQAVEQIVGGKDVTVTYARPYGTPIRR